LALVPLSGLPWNRDPPLCLLSIWITSICTHTQPNFF
jgi:hypothetical protein